jgi:flagellar motor component MotA
MNMSMILFGFCLAVVTGAVAATTLARMKPHWSEQRRLVVASAILPTVTLIAALLGIVLVFASGPESAAAMRDLAAAAILRTAAIFAAIALAGSSIGAALRQRGMRR